MDKQDAMDSLFGIESSSDILQVLTLNVSRNSVDLKDEESDEENLTTPRNE
jgi:hypothetical protein